MKTKHLLFLLLLALFVGAINATGKKARKQRNNVKASGPPKPSQRKSKKVIIKQKAVRPRVYEESSCSLKNKIPLLKEFENIVSIYCPNTLWATVIVDQVPFPVWSVHRLSKNNLKPPKRKGSSSHHVGRSESFSSDSSQEVSDASQNAHVTHTKAQTSANTGSSSHSGHRHEINLLSDSSQEVSEASQNSHITHTEDFSVDSPGYVQYYDDDESQCSDFTEEEQSQGSIKNDPTYKESEKKGKKKKDSKNFTKGYTSVYTPDDEIFPMFCYDKAHLVPAHHFSDNKKATYTMNNAVPLLGYINQEWGLLEKKIANFFYDIYTEHDDISSNIFVYSFVRDFTDKQAPDQFWRVVLSDHCKLAMAFHSGNDAFQNRHTTFVIKDQTTEIPTRLFDDNIKFFPATVKSKRCNSWFKALLESVSQEDSQEDTKQTTRNNNNKSEQNCNGSEANKIMPQYILEQDKENSKLLVNIENAKWTKHQMYDMYFLTNTQQENLATMHILQQVPRQTSTNKIDWSDKRKIWSLRQRCYDRGHLIPRADFSADICPVTYSKYNWAPQKSRFNSQWTTVEETIRSNVRKCLWPVKIVTGVLFSEVKTDTIGKWNIPEQFYKLVISRFNSAVYFAAYNNYARGGITFQCQEPSSLPGVKTAHLTFVKNWSEFNC